MDNPKPSIFESYLGDETRMLHSAHCLRSLLSCMDQFETNKRQNIPWLTGITNDFTEAQVAVINGLNGNGSS